MSGLISAILVLIGLAAIIGSCVWIYPPLGGIVGGALVLLIGIAAWRQQMMKQRRAEMQKALENRRSQVG